MFSGNDEADVPVPTSLQRGVAGEPSGAKGGHEMSDQEGGDPARVARIQPAKRVPPTTRIPVLRPLLPKLDALAPYLTEIDENRWYTNHGPLLQRFEARLAAHLGVGPEQVQLVSNGTVALTLALQAMKVRRGGFCLMPSWTFVASAAAVCAANLLPHFVDVDPATWQLDPDQLAARTDLEDVSAVLVVSSFGAPVPVARWDAFTAKTGIPVLIDAAAGLDAVATVPEARVGRTPIMISLHATKAFGIGEGGLILSTDPELMSRARGLGNFGIYYQPVATVIGGNAKVSEYHAAVGLAALDQWPARRAETSALIACYEGRLATVTRLHTSPGFADGWVSSYCNVVLEAEAMAVAETLADSGIETRRWWRNGCHVDPAYVRFPRDPLPVTEQLGRSVLGLPFFPGMTNAEAGLVVAALDQTLKRVDPIPPRAHALMRGAL